MSPHDSENETCSLNDGFAGATGHDGTSRWLRRSLGIALAAALLAGCGGSDGTTAASADARDVYPLTFDNCGEQVTLDQRPERIFTSGTTPVHLLVSVGAPSALVGRSGEFGQPLVESVDEAVADVPMATPDRPIAELIIGSGADLFFSDATTNVSELKPQLEAAGVQTLSTCNPETFEELWAGLEQLGQVMASEAPTRVVIEGLQQRLEAVQADRPGRDRSAAVVSVFQNTL